MFGRRSLSSIRLPRPIWILAATVVLLLAGAGLRFWDLYRQDLAIRTIEAGGGWVQARPRGPNWLRRWMGDQWIKAFDDVIFIQVANSEFDDSGLSQIQEFVHLSHLDLSGTRVTDNGLEHLRRLTCLQALDLDGTDVTDAGLRHLRRLKELRQLDLEATMITDVGLDHLKSNTGLKELGLGHTRVTNAGIDDLKRILPELTIQRESY